MVQVIWTSRAVADLKDITDFIALDKPDAARRFGEKVAEAVGKIADFPKRGRVVPESTTREYREIIVPPCRAIYRLDGETAWVVRIFRGEQLVRPESLE